MNNHDLLAENKYIEVQEFLLTRQHSLTDPEFLPIEHNMGLDLKGAAMRFVTTYGGPNEFMLEIKNKLARYGSLTLPQMRAVLNVLMRELQRGKIQFTRTDHETADKLTVVANPTPVDVDAIPAPIGYAEKTANTNYKCYQCGFYFHTYEEVMRHKTIEHGYVGKGTTKAGEMVPVIKEAEKSSLDLSTLPDGRYACINPTGKSQYTFLMVKTIKKRVYRNRRFRYGRIITGSEWIEAGTREVREWSTDSKRLCGQQKPGEGYEGEYMDQLVEIMMAPRVWAMIFAKFIGVCFRCAKTLTDDTSRAKGYGPECAKVIEKSDYWKKYAKPVVTATT